MSFGTQVLGKDASCDVGTFYRSNGDEKVGICNPCIA